jgi:hypothetical protein
MGGVGAILQHDTKLTRTHCLAEYGNVQYPVTKAAGKQTQTMSVFVTEATSRRPFFQSARMKQI